MLIHDPERLETLSTFEINKINKKIYKFISQRYTQRVGLSVNNPADLNFLGKLEFTTVIQCPFNLLDQRFAAKKYLKLYQKYNLSVQIRSIYLQGLLLMQPTERPEYFQRWNNLLYFWDQKIKCSGLSRISFLVNFISSYDFYDEVVIGVNSDLELQDFFKSMKTKLSDNFDYGQSLTDDEELLEPRNWLL